MLNSIILDTFFKLTIYQNLLNLLLIYTFIDTDIDTACIKPHQCQENKSVL